ncbi:MAG: hypothetical protein ABI577_08905 [bacterium]
MRGLQPARPASKLQYALRAWCLGTAALYLAVTLAVVLTGGVDITPVFVVLVAFVLAGPVVFAVGCLAWPSREGWLARCLGLVMMVVGFVPLALFAALLIPFVFFSLPAAWRWRSRRA